LLKNTLRRNLAFYYKNLPEYNITYNFIDGDKPGSGKIFKANSKVIYVESISNPLMEVPALKEVVSFAGRK
jgi:cystathionine beta-lyase/cystathionine gamma-synthase